MSTKSAWLVFGLVLLLPLGGVAWLVREPAPIVDGAATQPIDAHAKAGVAERYCMESAPPNGVEFRVSDQCSSGADVAEDKTRGVVVERRATGVVVTGYEL